MRIGRLVITPTCINIPLTEHKSLELEVGRGSDWRILDCHLSWRHKADHAGPQFDFELYKLIFFTAKIYDHRHWNRDKNRWYEPGEQETERVPSFNDRDNSY